MFKYILYTCTKQTQKQQNGIIKKKIYYLAYGSGYISKNYMATYLWYLLYGSQFPPWNTSN